MEQVNTLKKKKKKKEHAGKNIQETVIMVSESSIKNGIFHFLTEKKETETVCEELQEFNFLSDEKAWIGIGVDPY
jgi:hypothetical protein